MAVTAAVPGLPSPQLVSPSRGGRAGAAGRADDVTPSLTRQDICHSTQHAFVTFNYDLSKLKQDFRFLKLCGLS